MNILQNIFAFIGTFIVISTGTMITLQCLVCFITWTWEYPKYTDYRIALIGIIVAFLLIPYYYLPA